MTFSSGDPRALALYIRAGMRPWWPLLYMEVEASQLGGDDAGIEIVPSDVAETADRSLAWTGVDRSADFAHYGSLRKRPASSSATAAPLRPSAGHGANAGARTVGGSITRRSPRMPIRSERPWRCFGPPLRAAD